MCNKQIRCAFWIIILIGFMQSALVGCTPMRLNNLMGKNRNAVLSEFGPPNQVLSDGSGGAIWVYTKVFTTMNPGYQSAPVNTTGNGSIGQSIANGIAQGLNQPSINTDVSYRMVYLDSSGTVYKWSIANP